MALRDIFDSDPRSKDQLRDELEKRNALIVKNGEEIERLHSELHGLREKITKTDTAALAGIYLRSNRVATSGSDSPVTLDRFWLRCTKCNSLTNVPNGGASRCSICGCDSPLPSIHESPTIGDRRLLRSSEIVVAAKVLRQVSPGNNENKAWQRTSTGLRNIFTAEHVENGNLVFQTTKTLGYALARPTAQTFWIPAHDVNEFVVAYEVVPQSNQTISDAVVAQRASELEQAVANLKSELDKAKSVVRQPPAFGTTNVNGNIDIRAANEQIASLTVERDRKSAALFALEAQTRQTDAEILRLRVELSEAKSGLNDVLKQKALTEQPQSKISRKSRDLSIFKQEVILAWMFSETHPKELQIEHGYLHLMGDGPWDNDSFGRLMEDQNFSLWKLPDADIAHLVVGHKNWHEDDLIAQIDARQGQELRIYSQEMWFAAMTTGRDPFDAEDPDLLQAFANGHEALEFLIGQDFPWPDETSRQSGGVNPPVPEELGVLESPMHLMDYRVGKTSPHSEVERRAILDEILCSKNLPFGDNCSSTYRANWGTPKSAQRLYRMASHIKFIVDGPNGSDYRKPVAREDWVNDLAWLKKNYFRKTVHGFKWPNTQVP